MSEKHTPGPWRWQRAENGQGYDSLSLVGSPDDWRRCEYYCFGWEDGSPRSRGPLRTPGHEHNHAPMVLSASGWHGIGDIEIEPNSPDAHLIAAAPELLEALKALRSRVAELSAVKREGVTGAAYDVMTASIGDDLTAEFIEAEEAIAKAEGR